MAAWEYEYYLTALADNIRTLARPSNILYKSGLLQDPCMINRDRDFRLSPKSLTKPYRRKIRNRNFLSFAIWCIIAGTKT